MNDFDKMIGSFDKDDMALARWVEWNDIATFSQAVKTIYKAYYLLRSDDKAFETVEQWEKMAKMVAGK